MASLPPLKGDTPTRRWARSTLTTGVAATLVVGFQIAADRHPANAESTIASALSGGTFHAVAPKRLVKIAKMGAGSTYTLKVPDVPAGATSAYLNVSTARATAQTRVSVCAGPDSSTCGTAASFAAAPGAPRPHSIVARLGGTSGDQITIKNDAGTPDVYVDLEGFSFDADKPYASYVATASTTVASNLKVAPRSVASLTLPNVPPRATAVAINIGTSSASTATYLSACPEDQPLSECNLTSALNPVANESVSNSVVVKLGGANKNQIKVWNNSGTIGLNAEVQGYFVTPAATTTAALATGKPSASNTGVPAGVSLRRHDGDLVITTAGTVVDGLDIRGFVTVKAANVTIKNSIIRGGPANYSRGLVAMGSSNASLVIQDSEIYPTNPSVYLNGLRGFNITARRLDVHGVVDSVRVLGNNVRIESSWLHDNVHYSSDPDQGGGPSHDDGVQVQYGSNIQIVGSAISGARNAAVMITQSSPGTSNVQIAGNWFDNGACSLNVSQAGRGPLYGLNFNLNRFGRATTVKNCAIVLPTTTSVALSANVWDDNGALVAITKGRG